MQYVARLWSQGLGWLVSSLTLFSACASTSQNVAKVAHHDLACDEVDVVRVERGHYAASGCGRGAVYVQQCEDGECRWGRLRHGHEPQVAARGQLEMETSGGADAATEPAPAPAPAPREVIAAPPPSAPAATSMGTQAADAQDSAAAPAREVQAAPDPQAGGQPQESPLLEGDAEGTPAPVPLSEGELSAPYEAEVPAQPVAQQTVQAPPAPLVESRPPAPAPSYTWVTGYWWWGNTGWLWVPGYWSAPVWGYSYVPGYWYWSTGYWWYWPGGWARPGTRIVVYSPRPRPHRHVQVRRFQPHRTVTTSSGRSSPGIVRVPGSGRDARPRVRPESRTVRGYPDSRSTVRRSPGANVGRVVTPSTVVPPRSSYGARRSSPAVQPRTYRDGKSRGTVGPNRSPGVRPSPRVSPRVAPRRSAPTPSAPSRAAPSRSAPGRGAPGGVRRR